MVRVSALLCVLLLPLPSALCPLPLQDAPPPPSFDDWLVELRKEALTRGITPATLDLALANLSPEAVILTRDRTQPEEVQSLDVYVSQRLSRKAVDTAQSMARRHAPVLERVRATYGVSGPMMIAIWGVESNFGQFTGVRPTVTALATVGFIAVGTLFSAMVVRTRFAELMLPVLLLPFLLPPLIAAVQVTAQLFAGRPLSEVAGWLRLLAAYDVCFVTLATLLFPATVTE